MTGPSSRAEWSLFDHVAQPLVLIAGDGAIVFANARFEPMLGHPPAGLVGLPADVLFPDMASDLGLLVGEICHAGTVAGGAPPERRMSRVRRGNGTLVDVEVTVGGVPDAGRWLALVEVFDVTDREKLRGRLGDAERELDRLSHDRLSLLEDHEQLELVLEGTRLGFWDWNPRTGAVDFSPGWAEMLGYRLEELTPSLTEWESRVHPDDLAACRAALEDHMAGRTAFYENVHRMRHREGHWVYILDRGKIFERDAEGHPTRFCGTHTDITREKQLEAAAIEANRSKTFFLASMSHELRTPLNAVLGLSEALLAGVYGGLGAEQRRSLQTIHDSGKLLLHVINDVLDIARVESGKLTMEVAATALPRLVAECAAVIRGSAMAKGQQLVTELPPNVPPVRADQRRLRQVVLNLLSNAVKFSPPGATITVSAQAGPGGGATVDLRVSDTGPGIPEADRTRVFEPFVRLDGPRVGDHPGGVGLGLTLVKRLTELQGGSVTLTVSPGGGTQATVTLPAAAPHERRPSGELRALRAPSRGPAPATRRRILVADDDATTRSTLGDFLSLLGYEVSAVADGPSAVSAALDPGVALVIVDVGLPGLTGLDAVRRIRALEKGRRKPIVMLTARAMPEDEQRSLEAGATCHVSKPVELHAFATKLAELLDSPVEG